MSLERTFRQVVAELELLSHGKTASWNSSGGKSDNPDPRPFGEAHPPHVEFARRWDHEPDRDRVLEEAREYLKSWKKRQAPAEGDGSSEDDWIVRDGRGFPPEDVARRFNTSAGRVRRLRKAQGLDMETGMGQAPVRDDSRERVLNLHLQGCTLRQIEFQTGVSKSRVQRWLKEAI